MPTYDYVCDSCKHEFEAFESIKADSQTICPVCQEPKLRRKIGAGAAILFKGSGFYQTDYRSESYKSAAKAEQEAAKPPANGAAATTDTAAKSDTAAKETPAKSSKSSKKTSRAET